MLLGTLNNVVSVPVSTLRATSLILYTAIFRFVITHRRFRFRGLHIANHAIFNLLHLFHPDPHLRS